jgi:DNA-binding LytR/AlgR family response regulator
VNVGYRIDLNEPKFVLCRTPLKELAAELDAGQFLQVHRVVDVKSIREVARGLHETDDTRLHDRSEKLPVSRTYLPSIKPG